MIIVLYNDVGDEAEVEHEERVDKTLDNEEHQVLRTIPNFLPFFMRCSNWPSGVQSIGFAEI